MSKAKLFIAIATLVANGAGGALAQEVLTGQGGPLNFDLGYGIKTHPGSTLSRRWHVLSDPNLPVSINPDGYHGLGVQLLERGYVYEAEMELMILAPIVAVEVVIIPFNVFNDAGQPLSLTHISDMPPGFTPVDGRWNVYSEAAALNLLTSFAYVDQVRLMDGSILVADRDLVLKEARKISAGLVASDLVPTPPKDGGN